MQNKTTVYKKGVVRPGLTHTVQINFIKIQQIQEDKQAIINENRKLNDFERKNNVICGLDAMLIGL